MPNTNSILVLLCPTCAAFKFEMAVGTDNIQHNVCSVPCDTCQITKVKGYRRVFAYVGAGHLTYFIQTMLPLQVIGQMGRKILYTNKDLHSLGMHEDFSNALICLILTLQP